MQSLYNSGSRQAATIRQDLEKLAESRESTPALQGQIVTSLSAFSRVIDDYEQMAKNEKDMPKREKGLIRIAKFREDHLSLKTTFESLKRSKAESARSDLFGGNNGNGDGGNASGSSSSTRLVNGRGGMGGPRQRSGVGKEYGESPFGGSGGAGAGGGMGEGPSHSAWAPNHPDHHRSGTDPDAHLLSEHSFLTRTEASLDQYLATGRAVLDDLRDQGGMMKGVKKRMLDVGVTLGASREVIGWVDRRTAQDAWIFFGGATFTLFMFWVIWHYLG